MAKKSTKSDGPAPAKPAVRRARSTKVVEPAPAAPARRRASTRTSKTVVADRGLTAAVSADVLATSAVAVEPTYDEIATRAYFIHLRRNGTPGTPDADWLSAIAELRRERGLI